MEQHRKTMVFCGLFPSTNPGVFGCFLKHAKHGARPAMFADYEAVVPILMKLRKFCA